MHFEEEKVAQVWLEKCRDMNFELYGQNRAMCYDISGDKLFNI